jgi:hypothetical protein
MMYCPNCKTSQGLDDYDYIGEGTTRSMGDPVIICRLCKYEFCQGESLDFEWDLMMYNHSINFPKEFFKEFIYINLNRLQVPTPRIDSFFEKWDLYNHFDIKQSQYQFARNIVLNLIVDSLLFRGAFRIHYGVDMNSKNIDVVVNRDSLIENIIN